MRNRTLKFQTIYSWKGRGKTATFRAAQQFISLFEACGFQITSVHGDNEFTMLRGKLHPIPLDIAARDEHVEDIERAIITVKERSRCTTSTLPFNKLPELKVNESLAEKYNGFIPLHLLTIYLLT